MITTAATSSPAYPENVVWRPQEGSQTAFMSSTAIFEVLYSGTRGSGKSDCLLMSFAQHVGRGYGADWKGILFRQNYKALGDLVDKSKKWFSQIWPQARFIQTTMHWEWPTGEKLLFRHANRNDDYYAYHGHGYPWVGWDELTNWPEDTLYKRLMSVCRSARPNMPRMYRATTNPYGPGMNWVKYRFALPNKFGKVQSGLVDAETGLLDPPRLALNSSIWENKILLDSDPDYVNKIAQSARNEAELQAWLYGNWDVNAGGMFDSVWKPKYNVLPEFDVPENWRITRSFDWGWSKPFSVCWWAHSNGEDLKLRDGRRVSTVRGDLFLIKEWYGWTGKPNEGVFMEATEIARGIVKRELKWGWRDGTWCRVKPGPADSSIFDSENGNCIATDMKQKVRLDDGNRYPGVFWHRADKSKGSRIAGWNKMRQMMSNAHPPKHGVREHPGLFVTEVCDQFVRTVPTLARDEKDPDDVDTNTEDHIGDAARYRVHTGLMEVREMSSIGMF